MSNTGSHGTNVKYCNSQGKVRPELSVHVDGVEHLVCVEQARTEVVRSLPSSNTSHNITLSSPPGTGRLACMGTGVETPSTWKLSRTTCNRKSCGVPVATGNIDLGLQSVSKVDETDQRVTNLFNPFQFTKVGHNIMFSISLLGTAWPRTLCVYLHVH